jgi:hypothetical protein
MTFSLMEVDPEKYKIHVEQYDFVLRSQVAEERIDTPVFENQGTAKQLIEYMLENVKGVADVNEAFHAWRKGRVPLVNENKNVLVKEAIRRRFARNLKRM